MSLYEIVSMVRSFEKRSKKHRPQVTDADWQNAEDLLASVTMNDPSVRLH